VESGGSFGNHSGPAIESLRRIEGTNECLVSPETQGITLPGKVAAILNVTSLGKRVVDFGVSGGARSHTHSCLNVAHTAHEYS
jgi:hypothetical protein